MKLKRVLRLKMSGEDVTVLQTMLKEYGFFQSKIDGFFGQNTLVSVGNFQKHVSVKSDGVVGPQTWSQLIEWGKPKPVVQLVEDRSNKDLDIPNKISFISEDGLQIYDNLLLDDEYCQEETQKNTIWLHHTAGGSRPDWTINGWETDTQKDSKGNVILDSSGKPKPLKVGTQFVIGRKSSSTSESLWDGKILKAFDDRYWSYHLGINKNSRELNSKSIGIEICNYGPLTLSSGGKFFNWVKRQVRESEVCELSTPFRGYKYWEKYTDLQLESTRKLILHLKKRWNIDIQSGIYNEDWFEYDEKWFTTGGLRSHTQVRKDKFDIFPQPELIQMLNSL
jgi:peptidoglycan hydrolase-like protein with peptidoglycan-binding domain